MSPFQWNLELNAAEEPVLLAIVVLCFVYSGTSEETGWEERARNDLFCIEWDVKP